MTELASMSARRLVLAAVLAVAALAVAGAVALLELREDPPSVAQPTAGDITGTLTAEGGIADVAAVSRVTGRRYEPAEWDARTGQFRFAGLAGDAAYDLCLRLADGRRVEGIDLGWHEARFLRLAATRRKELGIPQPPAHAFTACDAAALIKLLADRPDFANISRPLYIRGDGGRAVMLAERIRSEKFHAAAGGELIWRTDLMYFSFDAGGWQLTPDTRRLVERQRFDPRAWSTFTLAYDPTLTVHIDAAGASVPVAWALAAQINPATARLAGQPLYPKTHPVVSGIAAPSSRPATQPSAQ